MEPDHYATLGLGPAASDAALARRYRQLARRFHPDAHPGASAAELSELVDRMQAVNAAWEVLGDPAKRARYDDDRARPRVASPGTFSDEELARHHLHPHGEEFLRLFDAATRLDYLGLTTLSYWADRLATGSFGLVDDPDWAEARTALDRAEATAPAEVRELIDRYGERAHHRLWLASHRHLPDADLGWRRSGPAREALSQVTTAIDAVVTALTATALRSSLPPATVELLTRPWRETQADLTRGVRRARPGIPWLRIAKVAAIPAALVVAMLAIAAASPGKPPGVAGGGPTNCPKRLENHPVVRITNIAHNDRSLQIAGLVDNPYSVPITVSHIGYRHRYRTVANEPVEEQVRIMFDDTVIEPGRGAGFEWQTETEQSGTAAATVPVEPETVVFSWPESVDAACPA